MSIPDDRQLEDFLRGQGAEAAAYRSAASETPPPTLDAAVLALARAENAASPALRRHAYRDTRWQWPLALVGCFVIVSSLVSNLQQERPLVPDEAVSALATEPESEVPSLLEAAVERRAPDKLVPGTQKSEMPAPIPPRAKRREKPAAAPSVAEPAVVQLQRVGSAGAIAESDAGLSRLPEAAADEPAATQAAEQMQPAQAQELAQATQKNNDGFQRPQAAATTLTSAAEPKPEPARLVGKSPAAAKAWLARIRLLMKQDQRAEARRELRDFRQQYSNMMLLPDLQRLEAEPVPPRE